MEKDFNLWNTLKVSIDEDLKEVGLYPKHKEVWMCILGKNIGFEQNGSGSNFSRPALVIKKFNNKMFWVAPLSTKQKPFNFYYNFTDPENRKVAVILAQLRLVSIKRFIRHMYVLNEHDFACIKERLATYLI